MAIERGSLAIADISGYSSYLTGSELDHAHDVLADLLDTIANEAAAVFTLSKLEGDALFWYRLGEPDPALLFPTLEACYSAFRRRLRTIEFETTCRCNACRTIPRLDLKVLAHQAEFVLRQIAGTTELVGSDVILIHRMLKNHVTEVLGTRAYAMLTEPIATALGIGPDEEWTEHVEAFDDVGEVRSLVCDLVARWQAAERRTPIVVPADAEHAMEVDLPVPPAVVWEWLTSPTLRLRWSAGIDRLDHVSDESIPGVGTRNHCVHGDDLIDEEVVDWRPFHYLTLADTMEGRTLLFTSELSAIDEGQGRTRLSWRLEGRGPEDREAVPMIWPMVEGMMRAGLARLEPLLNEAAAGRSVPSDAEAEEAVR